MMAPMPESSIIAIGNELLRGFTVDTNSNWLAGRLFALGYPARVITVVGDTDEDIVAAIQDHTERQSLARILVCGGLGPTPDDRTYAAVGRALGRPLRYNRMIGAQMQNLMFARRIAGLRGTAELNAGNRKMAMLPEGAILLSNGHGMAPGLAFALDPDRYLFVLPGVPSELRSVFEQEIEPRFLLGSQADAVAELHYASAPESAFHDVMQALEREYPDVSLGSYPQTERRELILRATGPDPARVKAVLKAIRIRMTRYTPLEA
ncbi:MAG: competence/damage-inducible protein A [Chloroflexi bacterium]|nr:MAG: competence/damage-inducible protein A [Chloroflexota bacterium]